MKLFGLKLGREPADAGKAAAAGKTKKKFSLDLRSRLGGILQVVSHFQTTIIALAVVGLLAITALRMLQYTDPAVDQDRLQANLSKFKQIRIDSQTVSKIRQLQGSGTTTGPVIETGRTNPFSE
jgi:hypothetical protein